ncbi:MAG: TspO/MBR family protein [Pseudomonadota bacterium]
MNAHTLSARWMPVLLAASAAVIVAVMGALVTDLSGWYRALARPAWQPPDWVFGPVWTLIYALTAMAGVTAWRAVRSTADKNRIMLLFAINLLLNILWSLLFFRLHRPDWALFEVVALWLSIVALIIGLRPIHKATTHFLLPYLAWVSFAAVLNAEVVRLNPGLSG